MNKPNLAFVRFIETSTKTNPALVGLPYRTALERARRWATIDLLDGHIKYDPESDRIVQPEVCGDDCIKCRFPEVRDVRS